MVRLTPVSDIIVDIDGKAYRQSDLLKGIKQPVRSKGNIHPKSAILVDEQGRKHNLVDLLYNAAKSCSCTGESTGSGSVIDTSNFVTREELEEIQSFLDGIDFSNLATLEQLQELIGNIDLSDYVTLEKVQEMIGSIDLSDYPTLEKVQELIGNVDLSDFTTKEELNQFKSEIEDNISNVHSHDNLEVLNGLGVSATGSLLFNNKEIVGGNSGEIDIKITDKEIKNMIDLSWR